MRNHQKLLRSEVQMDVAKAGNEAVHLLEGVNRRWQEAALAARAAHVEELREAAAAAEDRIAEERAAAELLRAELAETRAHLELLLSDMDQSQAELTSTRMTADSHREKARFWSPGLLVHLRAPLPPFCGKMPCCAMRWVLQDH